MSVTSIESGQRFGRLTAVARQGSDRHGRALWKCRCECGAETVARGKDLRSGNTRSCGCLARESAAATGASTRRHGHANPNARTPTYRSWLAMRRRCLDPGDKDYPSYGGRGITICARWDLFEDFLADMGARPSLQHTIDRVRNDGNYEPANCRWATPSTQAGNRRDSHTLTIGTETRTLTEWARRSGLSTACLWHRLKRGISGAALLAPSRKRRT